jgi:hypothetical protein
MLAASGCPPAFWFALPAKRRTPGPVGRWYGTARKRLAHGDPFVLPRSHFRSAPRLSSSSSRRPWLTPRPCSAGSSRSRRRTKARRETRADAAQRLCGRRMEPHMTHPPWPISASVRRNRPMRRRQAQRPTRGQISQFNKCCWDR